MREAAKGLLSVLVGGVVGVSALAVIYKLPHPTPRHTESPSPVAALPSRSDPWIVQTDQDKALCIEFDQGGRPTRGYEITAFADINGDASSDFYDVDAFLKEFEACDPRADFNRDGFIDFYDVDDFAKTYESGCP